MVTFRYPHSKTKQYQTRTVTGEYFIDLLMLHVLPKDFRKTRCYGFLHPCSKNCIRVLQLALRVNHFMMFKKLKERAKNTYPVCGAKIKILLPMIQKTPGSRAAGPPVLHNQGRKNRYLTLKQHHRLIKKTDSLGNGYLCAKNSIFCVSDHRH